MTASSTELSLSNTASLAELSASWADQLFEIVKGADEQVGVLERERDGNALNPLLVGHFGFQDVKK